MPHKPINNFSPWDFYSPLTNELCVVDGTGLPFITYDNKIPCHEANMYILSLFIGDKTHKVSTLKTYASKIVHLMRYCQNNNIRFSQLTDAHFTLFVQGLQQRDNLGKRLRGNNTIRDIATRCLAFLFYIQELHDLENFIGVDKSNKIKVKIIKSKLKIEGRKNDHIVESVTHSSMPRKDAVKKRLPVAQDAAETVWQWIQSQPNEDKVNRDLAIFQSVEELGGRITEIHMIKVKDIEDAVNSGNEPYLALNTLKRRDDKTIRYLPVTHSFLNSIWGYIKGTRRKIIRRTIGKKNDHGYLFVSLTTGAPFSPDSATTYYNQWKKSAGVKESFHAHLFRHKFITEKLKEIISQHKEVNDIDGFRRLIINTEQFKRKLQQWTGHTQLHSLETYIHLAFEELNGSNKVYSAIQLNSSVYTVEQQVSRLQLQLDSKQITITEGLESINNIIESFKQDINNSLKTS